MYWSKLLDGLQLHNHSSFDHQVNPKPFAEHHTVVFESDHSLPFGVKPPLFQNPGKHDLVDRFEQAGSETAMDMERRIDDLSSYLVKLSHIRSVGIVVDATSHRHANIATPPVHGRCT